MKQVSGNHNVSIVDHDEYNPIIKCGKQIKSPLKNDVVKIIPGKEPQMPPNQIRSSSAFRNDPRYTMNEPVFFIR